MNKFVCNENMCTGCRACVDRCIKDAISIRDDFDSFNAVINESKCIDCGACYKVCPNNSFVDLEITSIFVSEYSSLRASNTGLLDLIPKHTNP